MNTRDDKYNRNSAEDTLQKQSNTEQRQKIDSKPKTNVRIIWQNEKKEMIEKDIRKQKKIQKTIFQQCMQLFQLNLMTSLSF